MSPNLLKRSNKEVQFDSDIVPTRRSQDRTQKSKGARNHEVLGMCLQGCGRKLHEVTDHGFLEVYGHLPV
jgi:hypothetical protein